MKTFRLVGIFQPAILLAGVLLITVGAGECAHSNNSASASNISAAENNPENAFMNARNPRPTVKTLYAIAEILAEQGKDPETQVVLEQIIRDYPRFVPAYNSLAEVLMRNSRTNHALAVMIEGLKIEPGDPVLLNNTGMCWIMRRKYDRALEMFTKAAGRRPENARYRANMAVALGLLGREEESLALFKQILPEDQANHNLKVLCQSRDASQTDSKDEKSS